MAVDKTEIPRLQRLYENGLQNGVPDLKIVGPAGIKEIEPNCSVSVLCFFLPLLPTNN